MKYDIIGDVHGCYDELVELLELLGYKNNDSYLEHHGNRTLVFVGDIVDRGPRNKDAFDLVKSLVDNGTAKMVMGNHDNKFARWLKGNPVKLTHGLKLTAEEFEAVPEDERKNLSKWLLSLPTCLELGDNLMVVHAAPGNKSQNMYGITRGIDKEGKPIREDWAKSYKGTRFVVYGHVIQEKPYILDNSAGIDTGCYSTGVLTALRWPEREVIQTYD